MIKLGGKLIFLIGYLALIPFLNFANKMDSVNWSLTFSYGLGIPGKNLKNRFGVHHDFGSRIALRTKKGWEFAIEGDFIFGNIVKEKNQLDSFLTQTGQIIDPTGQVVDVFFYERGYFASLSLTTYFGFLKINPESGFYLKGQFGFIEHWIKIDTRNKNIPILESNYLKGFDNLTNGFLSGQEIGYQMVGKRKMSRFKLGCYFIQGYTQNRRARNFDTKTKDESSRLDLIFGLKVGWVIALGKSNQEYFHH